MRKRRFVIFGAMSLIIAAFTIALLFQQKRYEARLEFELSLCASVEYSKGYDQRIANIQLESNDFAYDAGYDAGKSDGMVEAVSKHKDYSIGYSDGYDDGHEDGFDFGVEYALEEEAPEKYDEGYENGFNDGYNKGKSSDVLPRTIKEVFEGLKHVWMFLLLLFVVIGILSLIIELICNRFKTKGDRKSDR